MGTLEFPEDMQSIGEFALPTVNDRRYHLSGVHGNHTAKCFQWMLRHQLHHCRGDMPAYIEENAFEGIAKDNFTLEVPESAIAQYQTANGWRDFKRIAAHHELVCRPSVACALSTEHKQTLTINAEGEWEVASKPDWCEVSPSNGNKKTKVTLTIKPMAKGAGNRNGK